MKALTAASLLDFELFYPLSSSSSQTNSIERTVNELPEYAMGDVVEILSDTP